MYFIGSEYSFNNFLFFVSGMNYIFYWIFIKSGKFDNQKFAACIHTTFKWIKLLLLEDLKLSFIFLIKDKIDILYEGFSEIFILKVQNSSWKIRNDWNQQKFENWSFFPFKLDENQSGKWIQNL